MKKKNIIIGALSMLAMASLSSCGEDGAKGEKGDTGANGVGIQSISLYETTGDIDKYQIQYTDNSVSYFTVKNGKDGEDGTDGKNINFQITNGFLQCKYDNDLEWTNVLSIDEITNASKIYNEMRVNDGYIQWKYTYEADNQWRNLISLSTLAGEDGKDSELRVNDGYIQWRSSEDWENLIELNSLSGKDGREVIISTSADSIVWKYEGENTWNKIVDFDDLQGIQGLSAYEVAVEAGYTGTTVEWLESLKGATGEKGDTIELQVSEGYFQWKYTESDEWQNLLCIDDIKGENGKSAYQLYKDKYSYTGTEYEWLVELVDGTLVSGTKHKVTFITNDEEYTTQNVLEGKYAVKPTNPIREGYKFLGWFDDNDDKWVFNGYEIHQDIILTAKWEYIISAIHLNTNGAYLENKILYANEGDLVNLPTPVKEGYTFEGWYLGEEKIVSGSWAYDHDVTLEARWTANTYTITLNPTTGTLEDTTKEVTVGESFVLPAAYTPDVDKPFVGWFTEDGTRVTDMDGVSVRNYSVAGNVTLYARYGLKISTVEDLININNNLAGSYVLMNDIDMSNVNDWIPIGTDENPFTGTLNGNGHAISNFELHNNVGLFMNVSNATFMNLSMSNIYITSNVEMDKMAVLTAISENTTFTDINFNLITINNSNTVYSVGILTGNASECEINNCNVDNLMLTNTKGIVGGIVGGLVGLLSNSTINVAKTSGTINGGQYVGGIVGYNFESEYNECYNYSTVTGTYSAGIVGYTESKIIINKSGNFGICKAALINYFGCTSSPSENVTVSHYISKSFNYVDDIPLIGTIKLSINTVYSPYHKKEHILYIEDCYTTSKIYNAKYVDNNSIGYTPKVYVSNSYYITSYEEQKTNCVVLSSIEDTSILTKEYYINTLGWSELVWDFSDDSLGYVIPKLKFAD